MFALKFVRVSLISTIIKGDLILRKLGPPIDDLPLIRSNRPSWETIVQRLDHFNPADTRQWKMRYLYNDQFFEDGGPLFIYLGGEWEIDPWALMSGQIFVMAEEHKGYMVHTEHRFYGKSFPTDDMSTKNLQYLHIDQALADVIYLIDFLKRNISGLSKSKVVVMGGSYSACLATWIRLKYPHFVDIAYASSAALRAVADFSEYHEVVKDEIKRTDYDCSETISEGVKLMEELMETDLDLNFLSDALGMCKTLKNTEPHRSFFFQWIIADMFSELVQYAKPNSIQKGCDRLMSFKGNSLDKLIGYVKNYYKKEKCIGDYDEYLEKYTSHELPDDMERQYTYQGCTQNGHFQTTTSSNQLFGDTFPMKFSLNICSDLFGKKFNESVLKAGMKRTNLFYGCTNPKVTRLLSVHGTVDPWHVLGIVKDLNSESPTILIKGAAHCADLSKISDNDIPALRKAKKRIQKIIRKWLNE